MTRKHSDRDGQRHPDGGADAFKALALGATAVGLGRPYCYALAIAGERVRELIENFQADFDLTMGLAGCRSVAEIDLHISGAGLALAARLGARSGWARRLLPC